VWHQDRAAGIVPFPLSVFTVFEAQMRFAQRRLWIIRWVDLSGLFLMLQVPSFEILDALDLAGLQPAILLAPTVIRELRHADLGNSSCDSAAL
jgi:hypothetical protein